MKPVSNYERAAQSLDKDAGRAGRTVELTCGADLTPAPVRWLWREWLALGKLHLLAGRPGEGKTTLAMDLAATVTLGGTWPDGSSCSAGNVLIWSGEDDYSDTLLPRLMAAHAHVKRIYFIGSTRTGAGARSFDPSADMAALHEEITRIGHVSLIVVDPIATAVAGDSHKNTEVRRGLQPLVDLAAKTDAALLGVTHLSKGGQGGDPAQRVIGSIAFTAVARVVLLAARVQCDDGEKRLLVRSKSNIGPDNGGFEYSLSQGAVLQGIEASCVTWGNRVEGSARELLTDPAEQSSESESRDAVDLLKAELTPDSWTSTVVASQSLKAAGFSNKQIWRASKKLKVERRNGGPGECWYWRLPLAATAPVRTPILKGSKDSVSQEVDSLDSLESLPAAPDQDVTSEYNDLKRLNGDDVEVF